jgi:8-oxo-dGTP pyrophosphatase MutT (NUDIX family)
MRTDRPGPGEELNEGEVADAREAASLILLRDGSEGPEVLLVQRNPEQRFMGGAWVFPGGSLAGDDSDELDTARRELTEEAGIELAGDAELARWSRWITPAQVKVRFDTHFFVARAPDEAEPVVDGSECVGFRWLAPQEALDAGAREELLLVFPTIKHLEQLAEHSSVEEILEAARRRKVMPVEPRVVLEGGVAQVLMPGEDGYEEAGAG